MEKIKRFIYNSKIYKVLTNWLGRIIVDKTYKIDLLTVLKLFIKKFKENAISFEANAVAFNFTLAIFPAIIFIFTLIPYLNISGLEENVYMLIKKSVSDPDMYTEISKTIQGIISEKKGGLLTFGFLLALIMSTNGMVGLMAAFNKCYRTRENRNFFRKRLVALILTVILTCTLLGAILFLIIGQNLKEWLGLDHPMFNVALDLISFTFLFLFAFSTIYKYAPSVQKRWRYFSFGSIVATFLAISASGAFSYYLSSFATYNKVYGSIGTLIALMIWIQLISIVALVGFELNAAIDALKLKMEMQKLHDKGANKELD